MHELGLETTLEGEGPKSPPPAPYKRQQPSAIQSSSELPAVRRTGLVLGTAAGIAQGHAVLSTATRWGRGAERQEFNTKPQLSLSCLGIFGRASGLDPAASPRSGR
ncbi:hypothetical protein KIL84_021009 [Mauremys mutica]|uniref:Uncharacterized protein n=1 Tax=Mauremys mutica TaxID=74926 RepID=A0A9D3XBP1_9SAUR|nr:hypothetical protein KIL84_021009 [Mauremys mutica]